jgi:hypothetical protein
MVDEARDAGLLVSQRRFEEILGGHSSGFSVPSPTAKLHRHQLWWRILELLPKRRWRKVETSAGVEEWKSEWFFPLWKARAMNPGETIHWSVVERMNSPEANYHPKNVPAGCPVEAKRMAAGA